jgi:hypothetical protein
MITKLEESTEWSVSSSALVTHSYTRGTHPFPYCQRGYIQTSNRWVCRYYLLHTPTNVEEGLCEEGNISGKMIYTIGNADRWVYAERWLDGKIEGRKMIRTNGQKDVGEWKNGTRMIMAAIHGLMVECSLIPDAVSIAINSAI